MNRFLRLSGLLLMLLSARAVQAALPGPTQSPVIISPTSAIGAVGVRFDYQISATNSPTSFDAAFLPAGLACDQHTGLISGSPENIGQYVITLFATNAGGTSELNLTLNVGGLSPTIYTTSAATATVGQAFSYQISASQRPDGYAAAGLPQGLEVDTASGLISGTPFAAGSFTVALSATNANGTGSAVLVLTVASNLPTVTVEATVPKVPSDGESEGEITFTRTGDLSQKLIVIYVVSGSGRNGLDYETLGGFKKIKPNKDHATIHVIPRRTLVAGEVRSVKVKLLTSTAYQIGDAFKAKVKIVPAD